jgi:spermidine synthase
VVTVLSREVRRRIPVFLFASGLCALVYQVAWLRLLRLIFGASTASSAATLGIFMGGLGLGSLILGARVDRSSNPLQLYARLEMGIALAAGLSPWAIQGIAMGYRSLGGTEVLGTFGGTLLRLLLSAIVLGIPTFLMGGTLPAAVRAITREADLGRRSLGMLYGTNTLGAVLGAGLTTFFLIEHLGTQKALWLAALINLLVALWAGSVARDVAPASASSDATFPQDPLRREQRYFVIAAAGGVGLAFFVLELVWYRMLGPILGGSTYTFGVILTVALAGVGVGGWLYAARPEGLRPSLLGFSLTCGLEAVLVLAPFALGDRLAVLTLTLRDLMVFGFEGLVAAWFVVALIVVFPAAVVAGFQFPLLVGILGAGQQGVGRQIGLAYAANTLGAILGSVAGGFFLLPYLGALNVWRGAALVLVLLGITAVFLAFRGEPRPAFRAMILPTMLAVVSLVLAGSHGPGAFWRHEGIGAGRADAISTETPLQDRLNASSRDVAWEEDGRESSVALKRSFGYSFSVNGKSDGHAILDAGTQVMSPLVGALLHPNPKRGLVIGLGTGSSAGWLGAVPSVEHVDVYELEDSILRVARDCAAVNHGLFDNPKVDITIGDGRELLLTTRERYDLIFSEPSNPYRAGISSLFTVEFYAAAAQRLEEQGLFLQWLQAYEVDGEVVASVLASMAEVFPYVEVWEVHRADLLLVGSKSPIDHDATRIRRQTGEEPFRSALAHTWGVAGAEGFYSGFIASSALADAVHQNSAAGLNTDDLPRIEYGFARGIGVPSNFSLEVLRDLSSRRGWNTPELTAGVLDASRIEEMRHARLILQGGEVPRPDQIEFENIAAQHRSRARFSYARGDLAQTLTEWLAQEEPPVVRADLLAIAMAMAATDHPDAPEMIARLATVEPTEAKVVEGRLLQQKGDIEAAISALLEALTLYRTDPWPLPAVMGDALSVVGQIAARDGSSAARTHAVLGEPFAVESLREARLLLRYSLLGRAGLEASCEETFLDFEPYPRWNLEFLRNRKICYLARSHSLARRAAEDLDRFLDGVSKDASQSLLGSSASE